MAFGLGGVGQAGREYVLKIVADTKDATKGVDEVATHTTTMKDKMVGIGKAVATGLAVGAVVEFGKATIQAASDTEQALGGARSVFGEFAGDIEKFGKSSAKNLGISNEEFLRMSTLMGSLLKNTGIPMDQVASSTKNLTQRAADLAAMYGGTAADAMAAMTSALKGEFDPLENFGVSLKASTIEARAMAKGYVDASGKVTDAGKAMAAQELIMEQSADAAGTFAKESDSLAGTTQIMQAQFKDLSATVGKALLPIITELFNTMRPFLEFVAANAGWLAPLAGMILGIAAATKAWAIAQAILNSSLLANPIFLIVAAIAALVAAVIWAYNNVAWFRDMVDSMARAAVAAFNWVKDVGLTVFNWIKDNWPLLLGILTGPFGLAVVAIVKYRDDILDAIKWVYNWIKDNWPTLLAVLTGPFGVAVLIITKNWDTITEKVRGVIDAIGNFVGDLPNRVRQGLTGLGEIIIYPFKIAWDYIQKIPGWITDAFYGIVDGIRRVFNGLGDVITYPFRIAFDAIKWLWNHTVGGFGFTVPSWIPGIGGKQFRIPEMAAGGIVTRATIAMIGERGPEAVIPLDQLQAAPQPTVVNINVYALTANAEVGRRVAEALNEYQRATGKAIPA